MSNFHDRIFFAKSLSKRNGREFLMARIRKTPAFQWYPRDYLADALVVSMTLEQEGAYRRLMDVCWLECGLPNDFAQLWRLAKAPSRAAFARRIWPVVGRKFQLKKGRFQHKRLDKERAKQLKTRRGRQLAARGRWLQEHSKCTAIASGLQCSSSSSSSATAVGTKSTAAPRRKTKLAENPDRDTGTFALYCVIAREAMAKSRQEDDDDSISNVAEHFKCLCARRKLTYDSALAGEAIEATRTAAHQNALGARA